LYEYFEFKIFLLILTKNFILVCCSMGVSLFRRPIRSQIN